MQRYIKDLQVVYGKHKHDKPYNAIQELETAENDVNYKFGGKYVWLVPVYTENGHEGATHFRFITSFKKYSDPNLFDLARGSGGMFRYIYPVHKVGSGEKIVAAALVRTTQLWDDCHRNSGQGGDWTGTCGDLDQGRAITVDGQGRSIHAMRLYLVWRTENFVDDGDLPLPLPGTSADPAESDQPPAYDDASDQQKHHWWSHHKEKS